MLQDHADTIRSIYVGVSAHQKLELLSSLVKLLGYESLAVFGDCFDEVKQLSVAALRGHSSHLKWWQGWQGWQECQGIFSLPVLLQGILPGCTCWRLPPLVMVPPLLFPACQADSLVCTAGGLQSHTQRYLPRTISSLMNLGQCSAAA